MYCISVFFIIHFSKKWIFERLCWITGPCRTIQKDTIFISMKHLVECWNWYVTYFQVSFIWTDKCPFMEILFTSLLCTPSPLSPTRTRTQRLRTRTVWKHDIRYISKTLMKPLESPGVYASLPPLNLLGLDGRVYLSGMVSGMARASVVPRANSPLIRWIEDGRTHLFSGCFWKLFSRHVQGLEVTVDQTGHWPKVETYHKQVVDVRKMPSCFSFFLQALRRLPVKPWRRRNRYGARHISIPCVLDTCGKDPWIV